MIESLDFRLLREFAVLLPGLAAEVDVGGALPRLILILIGGKEGWAGSDVAFLPLVALQTSSTFRTVGGGVVESSGGDTGADSESRVFFCRSSSASESRLRSSARIHRFFGFS